ncbi:MAG: PQQ-binding-like beta-propeller repeat protein [Bacteroidales bacterium]|nr:PQQ-binding-like beta-propeller repeat protein [Bacteroidales bacterium]
MEIFRPSEKTIRILQQLALAAGLFAFILCILILVNFYQLKRVDPLNSPAMKVMIERLNNHPEDEQLKQEIRELDLLARKAFFANRWQIKTGGYLLAFSLLIVVISLKTIELWRIKHPEIPMSKPGSFWDQRMLNMRWVTYSGIGLIAISFLVAYLSHQQLGEQMDRMGLKPAQLAEEQPFQQLNTSASDSNLLTGKDSLAAADSLVSEAQGAIPTQKEINENFPAFRGIGGNGTSFHKNIPTKWDGKSGKNIKWKTAIPLPGFNSPVIWGNKVFLTGANTTKKEVYCFDLENGKILWITPIANIPGSPAGAPKVNGETGYSAPTVATDGRRVYAIFANGDLAALDMDGKVVWSKNLGQPKNHYGHSSSLLVYQDLLLVQYDQSGNGAVMAFNSLTGKQAWKTARDVKISWASPILVNTGSRMELILLAEPYMISYNPSNGKELWRVDCISGEVGPSAAYADGIAFSVNDYSKLAAVKVGTPNSILWENDEYLSDIPSPVANSKYVFLPTSYGMMVCYDAKTGNKYWEKDFGTPTYSSPMLVDGKVFQLDKKGVMHIFSPDKAYQSISEPQLGEGSVCTPAFSEGRIIIRGDKHLYCISN